ncbi:MAG: hypothetical protein ACRDL5_04945, partial [Solirubrobacteraceae bacterium]
MVSALIARLRARAPGATAYAVGSSVGLACLIGLMASSAPAIAASRRTLPRSAERAALSAVVQSRSTAFAPAVASPIVSTSSGDVALVAFVPAAIHGYGEENAIYSYHGGTWTLVATVPIKAGPPDPRRSPQRIEVTGALDFLVSSMTAGADSSGVVSDVGGRWRALRFAGEIVEPGFPYAQTEAQYVTVHGAELTTGTDDCKPDCAAGRIQHTTWVY